MLATAGPASAAPSTATAADQVQAAACSGYVHNSQWSNLIIAVKSSATQLWQFVGPGNTWIGDFPAEFVSISIPGAGARITYFDQNDNWLATHDVGGGVYIVNPCHEAYVLTPRP
jgi:hypothetical protein